MKMKLISFVISAGIYNVHISIIYNDREYLRFESYMFDYMESPPSKIGYYTIGAKKVVELVEDEIIFTPASIYEKGTWAILGERKETMDIGVTSMEEDGTIQMIRKSDSSKQVAVLKKIDISKNLSKKIPFLIEYENDIYVTFEETSSHKGKKFMRVKCNSLRIADAEEIQRFNRIKEKLHNYI